MTTFNRLSSWIVLHWQTSAVVTCAGLATGVALAAKRHLETNSAGVQRAERKREKDLRRLARKISNYARNVHKRYPTDVVVSQVDLAMQLRKSPEAVATALSLMLDEQRVQRAALNGYWKLDV